MSSRRTAAHWAAEKEPDRTAEIDVLIPTAGRVAELAVTLAGLAAQDDPGFSVTISDQSPAERIGDEPAVAAMVRVLQAQGRRVRILPHLPRRGLAEQRHFLLGESTAPAVLFLDDDVWLEPGMLARLHTALSTLHCGFVGAAVQGLSYLGDRRPAETDPFEPWPNGEVTPERMREGAPGYERWTLHNAANLTHLADALGLSDDEWLAYKIAWLGGCVLYSREALVACGGFEFWNRLPPEHAGEDVAAEWRVMEAYGGAGILPSGAVHLEAPTTVPNREVQATQVVFR
jgi:GT2 family glycosyltransferase